MKSKYILLLLAAAGTLSLAGCQKTGLFGTGGGEIRFSATASPAGTKTEYGNVVNGDDGLPIWQSIDWTADDQIRIYSDYAVRRVGYEQGETDLSKLYHWADYSLTNIQKGTANDQSGWSSATLENLNDDGNGLGNGLFWPDNTTTATFYAIYPKPVPATGGKEDEGVGMIDGASGKLRGWIDFSQRPLVDGDLEHFGYMTAIGSAKKDEGVTYTISKPATDAKTNVALNFYPAFTAFEISIRSAGDAIALSEFKLVSDNGQKLAGDFYVQYTNGAPTYHCEAADKTEIVVDLQSKVAPAAADNKDLTFTVLALPQDFSQLHVEFTKKTGDTRKLALKKAGEYITFTKCRKHRIYGLALPNGELLISVGSAPWYKGGLHTFETIEDASTMYDRYRYTGTKDKWADRYVAIAPGYEAVPVNPDDPASATTNRPKYSTMFTLSTVSVPSTLEIRSDNPKVGFVQFENGVYSEPKQVIEIPKSEVITATAEDGTTYTYGSTVTTVYFVVPLEGCEVGAEANISLIRTDFGVPVAYTHAWLPGTTDHTKVKFKVVTPADYTDDSKTYWQENKS